MEQAGMARQSEKPAVFRLLFDRRYNWKTGTFTPQTVTSDEIQEAILQLRADEGISLAVANPANFLKDFLRSTNRNVQWPQDIANVGFTARQSYSEGRVFDFVPYALGQTVPFPDDFELPSSAVINRIETVSLPSALGVVCIQGFRFRCVSDSRLLKETDLEQTDTDR